MHAQLSRNARGLKFSLNLNGRSYMECAIREGSDQTVLMAQARLSLSC